MKITLVRHGQTDFNYDGIMQGLSNNYLNDTGRRQCRKLRDELMNQHFDICYMSPLIRTVETAIILIGERVETVPDKRIIERNLGELEGKPRDLYDSKKFWDYNLNYDEFGVEKIQDIFSRCRDFLIYVINKNSGKDILIVSHGAPVRAMHHILKKTDLNGDLLNFKIDNCFCETIEINEEEFIEK